MNDNIQGTRSLSIVSDKRDPSMAEIADMVRARRKRATERLDYLRKSRDDINTQIREALAEETEAARIEKALEPRKGKS